MFFFRVRLVSSRRRSGHSSCTLTLVLLVGAWEADHVLNFVTVGAGGGGGLDWLAFLR